MGSSTVPQDPIRRRNRAVEDDAWIRDFLRRAPTCTVGMVHDGWPFLNSNLFLFDEAANAIYFHTAGTGRTRSNLEEDGRVCVSVSELGRLLPAERASGVSAEYAGVVLFGRAVIVTDLAEMRRALEGQLDKYFPHLESGRDYAPFTEEEMLRATVYRIDIERWTAKEHREPEDFPGAFAYTPR
jgi:nitroimidazol reductase NimA-like FMN-containing flavoprotein (pyridoxamine 5'-phosphate oxidase superfamily)